MLEVATHDRKRKALGAGIGALIQNTLRPRKGGRRMSDNEGSTYSEITEGMPRLSTQIETVQEPVQQTDNTALQSGTQDEPDYSGAKIPNYVEMEYETLMNRLIKLKKDITKGIIRCYKSPDPISARNEMKNICKMQIEHADILDKLDARLDDIVEQINRIKPTGLHVGQYKDGKTSRLAILNDANDLAE